MFLIIFPKFEVSFYLRYQEIKGKAVHIDGKMETRKLSKLLHDN